MNTCPYPNTTLEQHDIAGRGTLHLMAAPFTTTTLTVYTRTPVLLDGHLVHVVRIEGLCHHDLYRVGTRLGIVFRPVTTGPLLIKTPE